MQRSLSHRALLGISNQIETPAGPLLVQPWCDGRPVNPAGVDRRAKDAPYARFRALPVSHLRVLLGELYDLHRSLDAAGWVAGDLYDGCLLWRGSRLWVIDLDHYTHGPTVNTMGRMFGSTRFMAPEEFERGALIDARTTVFNLGRFAFEFLGDSSLHRSAFRGTDIEFEAARRACQIDPTQRWPDPRAFAEAWVRASTT